MFLSITHQNQKYEHLAKAGFRKINKKINKYLIRENADTDTANG